MKKLILVIAFILVFLLGAVAGVAGVYFVVLPRLGGGFAGGAESGAGFEVPTANPFESGYQNPFSGVNPFAK